MFVHNDTDREIFCRRGDVDLPERGIALRFVNVISYDCYRHVAPHWELAPEAPCPAALRRVLDTAAWDGTSVAATGQIAAPANGQLMRPVTLRIGAVSRTLVARGRRQWVRQGSDWVPSLPAAWQPLSLDWAAAFGGTVEMQAGVDPQSGLPHPDYIASHPQNPTGVGFTPRETPEGLELPRLELIDDQLTRFGDLPIPGCFAPLDERLAGLTTPPHERHPLYANSYRSILAPLHIAPGYLVLPWQAVGTPLELTGVARTLSFTVPTPTVQARARRGRARTGQRLRAILLDTDAQQVTCVWQQAFVTEGRPLPDIDIAVQEAS